MRVFSILFTKGGETKTKRLLGVGRPNQARMMFQQQPSEIINTFQFMSLTFSHPCRHEASDESIRIAKSFNLLQFRYFTLMFFMLVWKLVREKLLEVRVDFNSPHSLSCFIGGSRAALCKL